MLAQRMLVITSILSGKIPARNTTFPPCWPASLSRPHWWPASLSRPLMTCKSFKTTDDLQVFQDHWWPASLSRPLMTCKSFKTTDDLLFVLNTTNLLFSEAHIWPDGCTRVMTSYPPNKRCDPVLSLHKLRWHPISKWDEPKLLQRRLTHSLTRCASALGWPQKHFQVTNSAWFLYKTIVSTPDCAGHRSVCGVNLARVHPALAGVDRESQNALVDLLHPLLLLALGLVHVRQGAAGLLRVHSGSWAPDAVLRGKTQTTLCTAITSNYFYAFSLNISLLKPVRIR